MEYLEALRIGDIRLYDNWASAPLGAILQMRTANRLFVGMRTEFPTATGTPSALLVLSDTAVGELITDAHLRGVALDISPFVEIVAANPAPFDCSRVSPLPRGALLRHPKQVYFVWGQLPNNGGEGAICVASNDPECKVGGCYPHIDKKNLVGVTDKVTLRCLINDAAI